MYSLDILVSLNKRAAVSEASEAVEDGNTGLADRIIDTFDHLLDPDRPDIIVRGLPRDTVFLLLPESRCGSEWMLEHLPEDTQRFGGGVAVEHGYVMDIINGATADGLVVVRQA